MYDEPFVELTFGNYAARVDAKFVRQGSVRDFDEVVATVDNYLDGR